MQHILPSYQHELMATNIQHPLDRASIQESRNNSATRGCQKLPSLFSSLKDQTLQNFPAFPQQHATSQMMTTNPHFQQTMLYQNSGPGQ
jgi:hypothetical protein